MDKLILSDLQRQQAEDNHNLIYSYAYKHKLSIDYWYDILALAYCRGIYHYDEHKGVNLSTYLYKCMHYQYLSHIRNSNAQKRQLDNHNDSLSVYEDEYQDSLSWLATKSEFQDIAEYVSIKSALNNVFAKMTSTQQRIVSYILSGVHQSTISNKYNVSQSTVSRTYTKFKKMMKDELYN